MLLPILSLHRQTAMNRKLITLISVGALCLTAGCEKKSASLPMPQISNFLTMRVLAATAQRYIAESQKIEVITTEPQLEKSWESLVAYCGSIQCEVTSSSITTRTSSSEPTGTVSMRVAPGDLSKLLAEVEKLGKIAQHTTQREDKTADVVDADARINNLTSFRDNLRKMLAKPFVTVKDLLEIQQQLTDTQSQLETETGMRKVLANETEKIAVDVSFEMERPSGNARGFAEIWEALRESGSVLADSTASLITVIVTVIPWLILIVPGIWLFGRAWRRLRRNRAGTRPPVTTP